jgi:hypothetical protein
MSTHLNSYSDTMFLTLQWALQDREAMLDALSVESEKEEVRKEIRAIKRLRHRLFGDRETKMEEFFRTAKRVPVSDLLRVAGEK